jgi:hypothetical protein
MRSATLQRFQSAAKSLTVGGVECGQIRLRRREAAGLSDESVTREDLAATYLDLKWNFRDDRRAPPKGKLKFPKSFDRRPTTAPERESPPVKGIERLRDPRAANVAPPIERAPRLRGLRRGAGPVLVGTRPGSAECSGVWFTPQRTSLLEVSRTAPRSIGSESTQMRSS